MTVTTLSFQRVKVTTTRHGHCPGCGQRVARSRTFEATVNPWNLIEGGSRPRNYVEVFYQARKRAEDWQPTEQEYRHAKCVDINPTRV